MTKKVQEGFFLIRCESIFPIEKGKVALLQKEGEEIIRTSPVVVYEFVGPIGKIETLHSIYKVYKRV